MVQTGYERLFSYLHERPGRAGARARVVLHDAGGWAFTPTPGGSTITIR
ncbi:hypothetical protein HMPREF0290_2918 [Corynebacterium efficiens YS-314]|nr:hypothetical protein HMPREF0290_2918 [Corynebacterium efficiens YS-314]